MPAGYLHPGYLDSLSEFGDPSVLPHSGGGVLSRAIPGTRWTDAISVYPLFFCTDWDSLPADLEEETDWVSLTLVTEPLGHPCQVDFPDHFEFFKRHYLIELDSPTISNRHWRNIRKAQTEVRVDRNPDVNSWCSLYTGLVQRRSITGIQRFSPGAFSAQFSVPGMGVFRAVHRGDVVAMALFFQMGEVVYYHLGASSEAGYQVRGFYALFKAAIDHYASAGVRWMNLGGGAGLGDDPDGGLAQFKSGWATTTLPTYLAGRIFDPDRYRKLAQGSGDYFPAYRSGRMP